MAYKSAQDVLNDSREAITDALTGITSDHANIHTGKGFQFNYSTTALAIGTKKLLLRPSTSTYIHLKAINFSSNQGGIFVKIEESPSSATTGSTQITPYNRNRNSATTSRTTVYKNPTGIGDGTIIFQDYLGGGSGQKFVIGGSGASDIEWILHPARDYVVQIINQSSATAALNLNMFWYEETLGVTP